MKEEEEEDAASNANGMQEIASRFPVSLFSLLPSPYLLRAQKLIEEAAAFKRTRIENG